MKHYIYTKGQQPVAIGNSLLAAKKYLLKNVLNTTYHQTNGVITFSCDDHVCTVSYPSLVNAKDDIFYLFDLDAA